MGLTRVKAVRAGRRHEFVRAERSPGLLQHGGGVARSVTRRSPTCRADRRNPLRCNERGACTRANPLCCNGSVQRALWRRAGPGLTVWPMNKTQLVEALAERLGDRRTAATAIDGLLETIVETVRAGETVTITGFGVFESRARAARTARNPRTGEAIAVPAATVPAFRPGAGFRSAVGGSTAPAPRRAPARAAATPAPAPAVEAPAEKAPAKPARKTAKSKQSFAAAEPAPAAPKAAKKAKAEPAKAAPAKAAPAKAAPAKAAPAKAEAAAKPKAAKKAKAEPEAKPKAKKGKK